MTAIFYPLTVRAENSKSKYSPHEPKVTHVCGVQVCKSIPLPIWNVYQNSQTEKRDYCVVEVEVIEKERCFSATYLGRLRLRSLE